MEEHYATKSDVQAVRTELQAVRNDLRRDLQTEIGLVRGEIGSLRDDLSAKIEAVVDATRANGIVLAAVRSATSTNDSALPNGP